MSKKNVIIIGAGMAGLTTGRILADAGENVTVLEARNRVGGRIHTLRVHGQTLELGAEFVHGLPPELWRIIREENLRTEELQGKHICYRQERLSDCGSDWDNDIDLMEGLKGWQGKDCSFADYLNRMEIFGEHRQRLIAYIEGFNAADHRLIGVASLGKQQAAEDAIEGDRMFRLCDGYSQVPDFVANKLLLAGGKIFLNTNVKSISWKQGRVEVTCSTGDGTKCFLADRGVITLPLGVLQSGSVKFFPEPTEILEAAALARMGHVRRIELLFRERFWERWKDPITSLHLDDWSFLFAIPETPSTWSTQFPTRNACLTAWTGGPRAAVLAGMNSTQLREKVCEVLSHLFHLPVQDLQALVLECHSHDWQTDPLSMGAYSYLPVDALSAPDRMSVPVSDTLYFAGEHTDTTGNWGTVHAALASGVRAAKQILNAR